MPTPADSRRRLHPPVAGPVAAGTRVYALETSNFRTLGNSRNFLDWVSPNQEENSQLVLTPEAAIAAFCILALALFESTPQYSTATPPPPAAPPPSPTPTPPQPALPPPSSPAAQAVHTAAPSPAARPTSTLAPPTSITIAELLQRVHLPAPTPNPPPAPHGRPRPDLTVAI